MGCSNLLVMALLGAVIGLSLQQPPIGVCFDALGPHPVGTYWFCPPPATRICECGAGGKIIQHSNLGHCTGQGDVHYKSFDDDYFDLQGVCRYVLSYDIYDNKFSIAVQQEPWLNPQSHVAISHAFTIRFGNYVIELTKNPSKFELKTISPAAVVPTAQFHVNNADVYADIHQGHSIFIALKKIGVWFKWNFNMDFDVWVEPTYEKHVCGICGNFDGDRANDLKRTPSGDPVTNVRDWGIAWRTSLQPASRCANGHEPPHGRRKRLSPVHTHFEACEGLITGPTFGNCGKDKGMFIENCIVEMDACQKYKVSGCMVFGLGSYVKACKDDGHKVSNAWKAEFNCKDCAYKRFVYEHLMYWTDGCITYQCKNGKIVQTLATCCVENGVTHQNGATWVTACDRRQCVDGKITVVPNGKCGCTWIGGEKVPSGGVKIYGCYKYSCVGRTWRYKRVPCCYHSGTKKQYIVGQSWDCTEHKCCRCYSANNIGPCASK